MQPRPWLTIWFSPRATLRVLLDTNPKRGVLLVSWLAGCALMLCRMAESASDKLPLPAAALFSVLAGPLLGFFLVFTVALFVTWTGRWLGGKGAFYELRTALAWAYAPMLLGFLTWPPPSLIGHLWAFYANVAEWGLILWCEVLAVLLIAEAHRFTVKRAIVSVILGWIIKISLLLAVAFTMMAFEDETPKPGASPKAEESSQRTVTE